MLAPEAGTSEIQPAAAPVGGTLDDWLDWQNNLHTRDIALGLDRIKAVAQRLGVLQLDTCCVIVAGTNGKGSCVRLLESFLRDRGRRVGAYTSPHLWRYNERVRIDATEADDTALCTAFAAVEAARDEVPLTYFEYGTLAALWLFREAELDYVLLEVGLGGRLDAVNIIDADVALITNIGLDHVALLGDTREAVGSEKAGVMRTGQPVVCTDRDVPQSVTEHARSLGASLYCLGQAHDIDAGSWRGWSGREVVWPASLPPAIQPDNLAGVLAVLSLLEEPPSADAVQRACERQSSLHGRCEVVANGDVPIIYDVGHNAEAVEPLVQYLRAHAASGKTHVVIGMLADKPVEQVTSRLAPQADVFYTADLSTLSPRGADDATLARRIGHGARPAGRPDAALASVQARAERGDRIVVCGSFFMIGNARKQPC